MVARRRVAVPVQTVFVSGTPVRTTVTARPAVVRQWVYTTRWRLRSRPHPTVGLGVQWTLLFRAGCGGDERPDTLQLCVGRRCLIFQIGRAGGHRIPRVLRRFLADRLVLFAAYNVGGDRRRLRDHYGLRVASTLELRAASGLGNSSLAEMAKKLLGRLGLHKSREVAVSDWGVAKLSKEQVQYACEDVYISFLLGALLRPLSSPSEDEDASSEASW